MIRTLALVVPATLLATTCASPPEPQAPAPIATTPASPAPQPAPQEPRSQFVPDGYRLVWADEFNQGTMPDPDRWGYATYRNKEGWWNNELQYYGDARPENSRIEDGRLIIEARIEPLDPKAYPDWGGQDYTSARLRTRDKAEWQYGYFEIRARMPCGNGLWAAIWTLPSGSRRWPDTGEIDIMEFVGYDPFHFHATVHTKAHNHRDGSSRGGTTRSSVACDTFHTHSLTWTEEAVTMAMDGEPYYTYPNMGGGEAYWPFDRPHYLIMNLAIGGVWGGAKGLDLNAFPARMEVDYVRVYQRP